MKEIKIQTVVLGGGPGGYTAAFRAADLGQEVLIVDDRPSLGGVCLNIGCIPSKTLLHIADVIAQTEELSDIGVTFHGAELSLKKLREHKDSVVSSLTGGIDQLCTARKIQRLRGIGTFISENQLKVVSEDQEQLISFEHCIIAAGSRPVKIPKVPYEDPRIWDSTDALEIKSIPKHLVIVGGGIIGLEMAAVYQSLGSAVIIVEMTSELLPGADKDLKQPLIRRAKQNYAAVYTSTKVASITADEDALHIMLEGDKAPKQIDAEAVLIAVGRRPNSDTIGRENAKLPVDGRGFITVDEQLRTGVPGIFAIGDITGNPQLAHKASHQGKIAAEVISGKDSVFSPMAIPSVAYTYPEIAWAGITEQEAKAEGIPYRKGRFSWKASGRAKSSLAENGVTKVLFHKETGRIIGAGITGAHAGELIGEAMLAMEMGASAEDIAQTIHPHPTFSETFALAAEMVDGSVTEMLVKDR